MKPAELVARLFAARTAAHMAHLQTTSYAQHMALGEFYEAIVDLADRYAEAYQGCCGVMDTYPSVPLPTGTPAAWLPTLRAWVRTHREECADGKTELANLIDEVLAQLDSTIYKIQRLR